MDRRRTILILGLILLLSVSVRLLELYWISDHPFFRTPVIDAAEYDLWAGTIVERLKEGEGLRAFVWDEVPIHGPGYPWLLACFKLLTGGSRIGVGLLQLMLFGPGICLALFFLAGRSFPEEPAIVGLTAAGTAALYIPLIRSDPELLATSLVTLLLLLAALSLTRRRGRAPGEGIPGHAGVILAGFLLGLAAITRPNALLCLPLVSLWIIGAAGGFRRTGVRAGERLRALGLALLLCLAASIPVLPVTGWNARLGSGSPLMIQANGGLNLYLGNNADAPGTPYVRQGVEWIRLLHAPRLAEGLTSAAEQDGFYLRKAGRFLRDDPPAFAGLVLRKLYFLFNATEASASISPDSYPGDSLQRFPLPRFGWVCPLALAGLLLALRRRRPFTPALVLAGAYALTLVATMISGRYRLPLVPLIMPHAAWALLEIGRMTGRRENAVRQGERPGHWLPLLAALFVFCNTTVLHHPRPGPAEDHYLLSHVYYKQGEYHRALASAEQAVRADGDYALGHYQLALCLERGPQGRRYGAGFDAGNARRHYQRAVALAPDYTEALENLGALELREGRLALAEELYRRAAESRPFRARPWHARGVLAEYGADGRRFGPGWNAPAAERWFRHAAALEPDWAVPHFDLGVLLSRSGRHREAAAAYEQVLSLEPGHRQARQYLALAREEMAADRH